ncbi:hypothetical protein GCM10010221_36820 [Streptomyces parvus]|nr:hypothetical protein GCM10010221_36820 [Streptomyces parvus]
MAFGLLGCVSATGGPDRPALSPSADPEPVGRPWVHRPIRPVTADPSRRIADTTLDVGDALAFSAARRAIELNPPVF